MATTKTTAAKRTSAAKKATAKTATAKKTTAKKTTARKTTAKKTTASSLTTAADTTEAVRESIKSAAKDADDTFKQYSAVAGDQLVELRQLAREAVDLYVGIPIVLGSRFAGTASTPNIDLDAVKTFVEDFKARLSEVPSVDFDAVRSFIDEAKAVGHSRVTAFETQAAAAADTVGKRVDEATSKLGAQLPSQVVVAFANARAQLRSLYAA
jgi:hypothetical protein